MPSKPVQGVFFRSSLGSRRDCFDPKTRGGSEEGKTSRKVFTAMISCFIVEKRSKESVSIAKRDMECTPKRGRKEHVRSTTGEDDLQPFLLSPFLEGKR